MSNNSDNNLISMKDINNGLYYIHKNDEDRRKREIAFQNLYADFSDILGSQEIANIVYNALNTYCFYCLYTSYQFPDNGTNLFDDFINRIYLPTRAEPPIASSTPVDWIKALFKHIIVCNDHNLYFYFQYQQVDNGIPYTEYSFLLKTKTFQDMYVLINNHMLDTLKRILLKRESTSEISKYYIPVLNDPQTFWDNYRFNRLINCFRSIRDINDYNPTEIKNYDYCSIVINNFFYIFRICDGNAELIGNAKDVLMRSLPFENTHYNECPWCIRMQIARPIEELKSDFNIVLPILRYFTMGNKETLDTLAEDFVHLIMASGIKRRNTIVSGSIRKAKDWLALFEKMRQYIIFSNCNTVMIDGSNLPDCQAAFMEKRQYCPDKNAYIPYNINTFPHCYCLCDKNNFYPNSGNKHIPLNFDSGGEYTDLPTPGEHELIWIAELLFAHGWHIINKAAQSHKTKTRNIEKEFFAYLNKSEEPDGSRLPAALIYEIYKKFAAKEKQTKPVTLSELIKLLQENGFLYDNQKIRKSDVKYISEQLQPFMQTLGIQFDDKWTEITTKRVFYCSINEKLKQTLMTSSTDEMTENVEMNRTNLDAFDKYVKELFARYQHMFIYNTKFLTKPNPNIVLGQHLMK